MSWIYFLRPTGLDGPIKIGCSVRPFERETFYRGWSPIPLDIIATYPGGLKLEARLHAEFIADHSHGEWFRTSDRLLVLIEQMKAGTFDPTPLPPPKRILARDRMTPEAVINIRLALRLNGLEKRGVPIPPEVAALRYSWNCPPEDRDRRREVIAAFVAAHPTARKVAA